VKLVLFKIEESLLLLYLYQCDFALGKPTADKDSLTGYGVPLTQRYMKFSVAAIHSTKILQIPFLFSILPRASIVVKATN
jgi:hypothetical protein